MSRIAIALATAALLLAIGCGPATKAIQTLPEPRIVLAAPQAVLDTIAAQERSLQEAVNLLGAQLDDVKLLTEATAWSNNIALQLAPEPKAVKSVVAKSPDPLLGKIAANAERVVGVLQQVATLSQQIQSVSEQLRAIRSSPQPLPPSASDQYGLTGLVSAIVGLVGYIIGRLRKPKPKE